MEIPACAISVVRASSREGGEESRVSELIRVGYRCYARLVIVRTISETNEMKPN